MHRGNESRQLVGPAAAPLERLHALPLAAVLDAHVVAHGVGVREVPGAGGDGADGAVARVVRLQVPPRQRQRRQPRQAQRALQLAPRLPRARARLQPPDQLAPAPLLLILDAIGFRRFCQRAALRGICNADTTMLLNDHACGWQTRRLTDTLTTRPQ